MLQFLVKAWDKLTELIMYPLSWVAGLFLFMADALTGGRLVLYIVIIASCIDLACGIAVAIKRKSFARSDLMRQTVEKLLVYGLVLLVFMGIDKVIETNTSFDIALTSGAIGVIITLTETWSFLASLLILFPNNPFLSLLQKALTGEIARKLGIEESEVAKALEKKRRVKKQPRDKSGKFVKK